MVTQLATLASRRFRLLRIAGVTLSVHWSLILFSVCWFWWRAPAYASPTFVVAEFLGLYTLVFIHELGHILMARVFHLQATEIILWPLGGFAHTQPSSRWGTTALVALAGPLVNLILLPPLALGCRHLQTSPDAALLATFLFRVNLVLLIFNLLPIWPLDGGQLVRSLLTRALGTVRGLLVSSLVSIALSGTLVGLFFHLGDLIDASLMLIPPFLNQNALTWSLSILAREKRHGFHPTARCPQCLRPALQGANAVCATCGHQFNPFDGPCWNCGTDAPIPCYYCDSRSPRIHWSANPSPPNF